MGGQRRENPLHAALYRPVLYAGLPQPILVAEILCIVCVAYGAGFQWLTAGLIAVVLFVLHPGLVWATSKDPEMIEAFLRLKLSYQDFYTSSPGLRARRLPVRPSIPRAR